MLKTLDVEQARKSRNFKLSLVAAAVLTITHSVWAQEESSQVADKENKEEGELLVITGLRQNLHSAQQVKKDAATVVDAISAKDASMLPDRSVLEALSRVPGISIGRFQAANDPDHFGVEGSGLQLRGLTQSRTEFNGRDILEASSGRGLSFEDVPPELMGGVIVYKNQTADMIEGGISGTISLNTKKPFDSEGQFAAFSIDGTYGDMRGNWTPSFSALFSNQWEAESGGRWGILLSASRNDLDAQSEGVQVGRIRARDDLVNGETVWVPDGARITRKSDDRERTGYAAALQWESADNDMALIAEWVHSGSKLAWTERAFEYTGGTIVAQPGTSFEYNSNGVFTHGVMTSDEGWRGNGDPERLPSGIFGAQYVAQTRVRDDQNSLDDISLHFRWDVNANLRTSFDLQAIKADTDILDMSVMGSNHAVVELNTLGRPNIIISDPAYSNNDNYFSDPHETFWRSAMDFIGTNEAEETAFRADLEYRFDQGWVSSIQSGVRWSKRDQTTRESTYNWGVLSEAWAESPIWMDEALTDRIDRVNMNGLADGSVTVAGGYMLFPAESLVRDYANAVTNLADARSVSWAWSPLGSRDGVIGNHLPQEINHTLEESNAIYFRVNFENFNGGLDYRGNFGLRYVSIDHETDGFINFPAGPVDDSDTLNFLPPDQLAFGNGASVEQAATDTFSKVLPSFNIAFELNDDWISRFGYSKAIALPLMGYLRNFVNITGDNLQVVNDPNTGEPVSASWERYVASTGNPYLKPMQADNYDVTLEYYFADAGSFSLGLFYKDVSDYFINGVTFREYTNNGATQTVEVAGATNGGKGTIKGFEIAYQQFFDRLPEGWDGLGVQVNYTYIDQKGSPNVGIAPDHVDPSTDDDFAFDNLPLEGLSKDNLNFTLMYEKYDISARLAYNYRSDYLLTTRDVITTLPIYQEDRGQLDASFFYLIDETFTVGLQASNINDEWTRTTMQYNQQGDRITRGYFKNDVRYSLILRAVF
jgi:TonB-dependent receptor